jgi:hypothetical protein
VFASADGVSAAESRRRLAALIMARNALFVGGISILNNVVIPSLVVLLQSSKCFYNIVRVNVDVVSSYTATYCSYIMDTYIMDTRYIYSDGTSSISTDTVCVPDEIDSVVTYQPPYSYSYECSSTILSSFAEVFLYQCAFAAFLRPLVQYIVISSYSENTQRPGLYAALSKADLFPAVVWAAMKEGAAARSSSTDSLAAVFDSDPFVSEVFSFTALLLSFGAVFPVLAVAFTVTIVSITAVKQAQLGYFLSRALDSSSLDRIRSLNRDLGCVTTSFSTSLALSFFFSVVFLSFFLFDIFGDQIGVRPAALVQAAFLAACVAAFFIVPFVWTSHMQPAFLRWGSRGATAKSIELYDATIFFTENPLRNSSARGIHLNEESGGDNSIVL